MDPPSGLKSIENAISLFSYNEDEKNAIRKIAQTPIKYLSEHKFYDPTIDPLTVYRECKNYTASSVMSIHHGQRKLFVGELQFLTSCVFSSHEQCSKKPIIVVYAGAAPGHHLPFLGELFPNIEWHLYDPATFAYNNMTKTKKAEDFIVYNEYFTDEVAASWTGVADIFVCDIRVGVETGPEGWSPEFEAQVALDMAAQDRWTRLMRPRLGAMLKFRPPYINAGTQLCFNYIKGSVLKQTWPSKSSTEGRLVVPPITDEEYQTMSFDIAKYQDSCAHHNIIVRPWTEYVFDSSFDESNDLSFDLSTFKRVHGFDRCFDCTNEAAAWIEYCSLKSKLLSSRSDPVALMIRLTTETKQKLVNPKGDSCAPPYHGTFPELPPTERINANYDNIKKAIETGYKTPHRGPTASQAFKPKKQYETSEESTVITPARGSARGSSRGSAHDSSRGSSRGSARGSARESARESVRGSARGSVRGSVRGSTRASTRGSTHLTKNIDEESFARAAALAQKLV